MYPRSLTPPNYSFFVFGPHSTGKTTLLRDKFPSALWFNLLDDEELFPLLATPSLLKKAVNALPEGSWVVIDEVQKAPTLLNQVHDILSATPD